MDKGRRVYEGERKHIGFFGYSREDQEKSRDDFFSECATDGYRPTFRIEDVEVIPETIYDIARLGYSKPFRFERIAAE